MKKIRDNKYRKRREEHKVTAKTAKRMTHNTIHGF